MRRCPAVTWLVTSRLPLGLADERKYVVEALDVPAGRERLGRRSRDLRGRRAVRRVRARGRADVRARRGQNVADVVAICRAVGGSPLAIELAAAQVSSSTPAQIRAGLEQGAQAGSAVRHAIMSSYALLVAGSAARAAAARDPAGRA